MMTFWARNNKSRRLVHRVLMGLLTAGGLWLLLFSSACKNGGWFEHDTPSQAVLPSSPAASLGVVPLPETAVSGPNGWWLVAQRSPQSDFGSGFVYFLVPADVHAGSLGQALSHRESIPPLCSILRGIRAVSLAPRGGRMAVLCGEGDGLWVWYLRRKEFSYLAIRENMLREDGKEMWLFSENLLWSADGSRVFVKVSGGYLATVDIREGRAKLGAPVSGLLLALDPRERFLVERVYDEGAPASDGSPKRYEISHLYLLDLNTGNERRWVIPRVVQKFLPARERCWVSDYKNSVGWEPQGGSRFLFMVECGQRLEKNNTRQYVFLASRSLDKVQVLWQSAKSEHVTALWEPHGQGVLLQIDDIDANGVSQGGKTVFLCARSSDKLLAGFSEPNLEDNRVGYAVKPNPAPSSHDYAARQRARKSG